MTCSDVKIDRRVLPRWLDKEGWLRGWTDWAIDPDGNTWLVEPRIGPCNCGIIPHWFWEISTVPDGDPDAFWIGGIGKPWSGRAWTLRRALRRSADAVEQVAELVERGEVQE